MWQDVKVALEALRENSACSGQETLQPAAALMLEWEQASLPVKQLPLECQDHLKPTELAN